MTYRGSLGGVPKETLKELTVFLAILVYFKRHLIADIWNNISQNPLGGHTFYGGGPHFAPEPVVAYPCAASSLTKLQSQCSVSIIFKTSNAFFMLVCSLEE